MDRDTFLGEFVGPERCDRFETNEDTFFRTIPSGARLALTTSQETTSAVSTVLPDLEGASAKLSALATQDSTLVLSV